MKIEIIKNMTPATHLGNIFGQDVEPKGTYVIKKVDNFKVEKPWVEGVADIKNPLIIRVDNTTLISYKRDLAQKYKAKGIGLTNKLMRLGYDAIITQFSDGTTGEIVLFPNASFILNTNESMKIGTIYEELVNDAVIKPIIAYHGTTHKITSFVDDFVGGKDALDQEGPGIYFTTSLNNAQHYGENVYKVELTPKKPVSTKDNTNAPLREIEWLILQAPEWEDNAMNWHENPKIGYKKAAQDAIQYNENPHQQFLQVWIDFYKYNPVNYVRNMVKLGYDSIIIGGRNSMITGESEITHIVVLNPSIIKPLN